MPEQIKGQILVVRPKKTQNRLFSNTVKVGEYHVNTETGKAQGTTLSIWVPEPTDVHHVSGIFLSLHNGNSRCFTRMSLPDMQRIISFLAESLPDLYSAENSAGKILQSLILADRDVHERLGLAHQGDDLDPHPDATRIPDPI